MAQHSVPTPITIDGLSVSWETAKKGLHEVIMHSADKVQDYIPLLYNRQDFKQKSMKKKVYAGLTEATQWTTNNEIPTSGIQYLYDVEASHYFYAKGTSYNMESKTFDEYSLLKRLPSELGKAIGKKKQTLGADFFNDAFSDAWSGDGKTFFAADHPYDDRYVVTPHSQSNLVQGALSVTTLQEAINKILDVRDPLGRPMNLVPRRLWVHPTKVMTAKQILGVDMGMEYGTPNNNRNPFKDWTIEVVPYPWFTTDTRWMLQANEFSTYYSMPVGMTTNVEETDAHGVKLEGWFSIAFWAEFWHGWVGSLGT